MKSILGVPVAASLCLALICSGCALVNGTTQRVAISTSVADAKVVVDGHPVGHTEGEAPLVVKLKRSSLHIITAEKEGYASNHVTTESQLSGLGIMDVIGTFLFLVPGISLLTGGAFEVQPSDVYITLDKKEAAAPQASYAAVTAPPVSLPQQAPPPVNTAPPPSTTGTPAAPPPSAAAVSPKT
jgi:PEGA domain